FVTLLAPRSRSSLPGRIDVADSAAPTPDSPGKLLDREDALARQRALLRRIEARLGGRPDEVPATAEGLDDPQSGDVPDGDLIAHEVAEAADRMVDSSSDPGELPVEDHPALDPHDPHGTDEVFAPTLDPAPLDRVGALERDRDHWRERAVVWHERALAAELV